jgi:preprotein translocase subunit YajC
MLLAEEAQEGAFFQQILMFGLIGLVFYFFMLRPQIKKSKVAKQFREGLAVGDKVVTAGGIHGKVLELNENTILISTEGAGKLRVEKGSVSANPDDMLANKK